MNERIEYLLAMLEVSEWCSPIHERVVRELGQSLAR